MSRFACAWAVALAAASLAIGCAGGFSSAPKKLDSAAVPEGLRDLVPLAEKWGTCDNLELGGILSRSTVRERAELREAIQNRGSEISSWLESFEGGARMSDEAAAFSCMVRAVNELPE